MHETDYCHIPLYARGGVVRSWAKIDPTDRDTVLAYRWYVGSNGYARHDRKDEGGAVRAILMHRLLLSPSPGLEVDHINGDRLDNRRANLRVVTHAQNMQNRSPNGHKRTRQPHSGYRGVLWIPAKKKWRVRVVVNGKRHSGGYFHDAEEAGRVAAQMVRDLMPFADRHAP